MPQGPFYNLEAEMIHPVLPLVSAINFDAKTILSVVKLQQHDIFRNTIISQSPIGLMVYLNFINICRNGNGRIVEHAVFPS